MSRIRLLLSYDGTDYHGWQKQPSGNTIQNVLEDALAKLFQEEIKTIGSGRTDTGVHALAQNVHFDLNKDIEGKDLRYMINSQLPDSIVVQKAWIVPDDFHALSSAESKVYEYRILQTEIPCPLRRGQTWWVKKLDINILNTLAETFIGEHDFKSFQSTGTDVPDTVRKITQSHWEELGEELFYMVEGEGFLKQMVRNMVGTMVELSLKSENPVEDLQKLSLIHI